jgi:hypothetical protein
MAVPYTPCGKRRYVGQRPFDLDGGQGSPSHFDENTDAPADYLPEEMGADKPKDNQIPPGFEIRPVDLHLRGEVLVDSSISKGGKIVEAPENSSRRLHSADVEIVLHPPNVMLAKSLPTAGDSGIFSFFLSFSGDRVEEKPETPENLLYASKCRRCGTLASRRVLTKIRYVSVPTVCHHRPVRHPIRSPAPPPRLRKRLPRGAFFSCFCSEKPLRCWLFLLPVFITHLHPELVFSI